HPHTMTIRLSGFCRTSRTLPSISSPTRLKGHFCLEMAQCSLLTLDAFCLLGDEEVSPGRTLKRCNTRFCEEDSQTLQQRNEAMIFGGDGGALRRPKILRFLQFP